MKYIETENEFNELIKEEKVLVDFFATWCGPCQMISPLIDEVSKEENLEVLKVDVDKFPTLATKYGIMVIPTLKLFKNGVEVKSNTGYLSKEEIKGFIK